MSKKNRDGDNEDKKSVKRQERSAPITRSIKKVGKKAAAIVADRLRADLIVEANEWYRRRLDLRQPNGV